MSLVEKYASSVWDFVQTWTDTWISARDYPSELSNRVVQDMFEEKPSHDGKRKNEVAEFLRATMTDMITGNWDKLRRPPPLYDLVFEIVDKYKRDAIRELGRLPCDASCIISDHLACTHSLYS